MKTYNINFSSKFDEYKSIQANRRSEAIDKFYEWALNEMNGCDIQITTIKEEALGIAIEISKRITMEGEMVGMIETADIGEVAMAEEKEIDVEKAISIHFIFDQVERVFMFLFPICLNLFFII